MVTAFADATRRARAIGVVVAALCCVPPEAPAVAQDAAAPPPASTAAGPWFVRITPYAWLPSLSGSTRGDRGRGDRSVPSLSIDKDFSDILSDLDFAGMIVGTVRYERIGLLVDLDYISLTVDGNLSRHLAACCFVQPLAFLAHAHHGHRIQPCEQRAIGKRHVV